MLKINIKYKVTENVVRRQLETITIGISLVGNATAREVKS
jgi:hypothetical protein